MSGGPAVIVVPTGTANLASVLAALRRVGAEPVVADAPRIVDEAERVVLPGVGTLAAAADRLRAAGLVSTLRSRVEANRPTLAICLGMQLLFDGSDESPEARGLGVIGGRAQRLENAPRVPHIGWNRVVPADGARLLKPGVAYFAHGYRIGRGPDDGAPAWTDYGGRFVSAFERGALLACQFHPELSGAYGAALIRAWLETGTEVRS